MNIEIISFKQKEGDSVKAEFCITCNGFRINGIRLIERPEDRQKYFLSYPFWKDGNLNTHEYMYPIEDKLKLQIETSLVRAYKALSTNQIQTSTVEAPTASLRAMNLKLKMDSQ